jgi:hypothetical protein
MLMVFCFRTGTVAVDLFTVDRTKQQPKKHDHQGLSGQDPNGDVASVKCGVAWGSSSTWQRQIPRHRSVVLSLPICHLLFLPAAQQSKAYH